MDLMPRHTRIICTLGPASGTLPMIKKMALRGMDIARINFSHGHRRQHQRFIDLVRRVNRQCGRRIGLFQDLEGYRIRVGALKKDVWLKEKQHLWMSRHQITAPDHISWDYNGEVKAIKKGFCVYIDDGYIALKVIGHTADAIKLEVIQGGLVKPRKGINIPQLKLPSEILTEKDRRDVAFGLQNRFDYIAQSFVRNQKDVRQIVEMVKPQLPHCQIIAKIENREGLENIDSILLACDGIMIARGDLGVSLPMYQIPMIQKEIIRRCNRKKKMVITATQMLDSMIEHSRPTRAEVTDIANAILDGTDCVMLSGETAVGKYPSRSILMMRQIIEFTEKSHAYKQKKGHNRWLF